MKNSLRYLIIALLLFFTSCSSKNLSPNLSEIYDKNAKSHGVERNPIILIPGILGSKLVDTKNDELIWGVYGKKYIDPEVLEDFKLISLPIGKDKELVELKDTIVQKGSLDRIDVDILGLPLYFTAYAQIINTLGIGGYRDEAVLLNNPIDYGDEHFSCFQFAYDWRRDNVENAKLLGEFIEEKKEYLNKEYKKRYGDKEYDIKFDIVAHSMGGLIARYYLRYGKKDLEKIDFTKAPNWSGAKNIASTTLIGTPNSGSIKSLLELTYGFKLSSLLPNFNPAVLGTMPSIYQLLPRSRHQFAINKVTKKSYDILDPELWNVYNMGILNKKYDKYLSWLLPNVKSQEERRSIAYDHVKKSLRRAKLFHKALDIESEPPENLDLNLFLGDAIDTPSKAIIHNTGDVEIIEYKPGDGVVLRSSALMDERLGSFWQPKLKSPINWTNVIFIFEDHLGITKSSEFADNLLFYLLEKER